jgi:hypothetical protein
MTRAPNWPATLARFIEERRAWDFDWGSHDCCMFAADWVMAATGVDPALHFRSTYFNARGAADTLRIHGGIGEIVSAAGFVRWQSPAMAQRGDVALVTNDKRDLLAVVDGAHCVAPGKHGLVWLPLADASAAWKV